MNELDEFRREVEIWFRENRPPEPDFLLPESFMEVGSDAQFEYLRDWQRKIYEADISVTILLGTFALWVMCPHIVPRGNS